MGRLRRNITALFVGIGLTAAACSSSSHQATVTGPALGWVPGAAEAVNGTLPTGYTARSVCGSATAAYLTELLTNPHPTALAVQREWGDIVPGGKQIALSGTVAQAQLSTQDLPMSHPFGGDLTMNVTLDPQFTSLSRRLGTETGEEDQPGALHVEIPAGLIPHHRQLPTAIGPATTWAQLSQANMNPAGDLPGFAQPQPGDRVVLTGRWIVDCGHADFHTEVHPVTFLAWAHHAGEATTVHLYANPYRDTELYNPNAGVLGNVNDTSRLSLPATTTFPKYLVAQILAVLSGKQDRLHSQELVAATTDSAGDWQACAPTAAGTPASAKAKVTYDLVTRPGVQVGIRVQGGCAVLHQDITAGYRAADATIGSCVLPWDYLNSQLSTANLDVREFITKALPPGSAGKLAADPLTACADALSAPDVAGVPNDQHIRIAPDQPFPVYGVLRIGR